MQVRRVVDDRFFLSHTVSSICVDGLTSDFFALRYLINPVLYMYKTVLIFLTTW